MSEEDVLVRQSGRVLHLTLNRPRVINAVTPAMIGTIAEALKAAESDTGIEGVLLDGAGDRGLCAGGDINMSVSGDHDGLRRFWEQEYALDLDISRYAKPFVALMDGITMGGGIGLAAHAAIRVVTERSRLALPEARIGFIPDAGGTHLLALAPGELGTHLALTAGDLDAGDAIACGFADHFVPSERLALLVETVSYGEEGIDEEVRRLAEPAPPARLLAQRIWIDAAYSADDVSEILARLDARPEIEAQKASSLIRRVSPTSAVFSLANLRRGRELNDLQAALALELRVGEALLGSHDMIEGVRAQIIDKDRNPQWSPAEPALVDREWVRDLVHEPVRQ